MERNFNVDRRFRLFADKLTSNHASKDLIIESSYNTIELSSNAVIFDGIVDLSIVTCNNINISNISEIVTKFLRVTTLTLPSNVVISYNSVNDGYIINTRVGYNLQGIGRSDAYFTYINVSGGDSSFNDSLYINKNLLVDGTLTINNDLLINGKNFEIIENSFNNYKASLEQNFYSTKITTKDLSALNISISNELVVNKTAFINDLTLSGQLLNNVLRVPNIFTIDPSGFDNHSGTLFINGDLTVLGAITTLSSSNIDICDVAITLASKLANRLDLINANAGLDISNIASLKYNGTSWDFSGGQLTLDNKKILFADDISLAKRNFDLSFNALNADFSSSFFILKRNIDNSFNNTYNRSQIDSSFILRSKVDVSLISLLSYLDNSYVSKNQFTNSFQDIITLMDISYIAKNSVSFDISFASFNTKVDLSYVLKTVFEASHNSLKTAFEVSFGTINVTNINASSITIDTINTKHSSQRFANILWNQLGLDISNGPPLTNNNKKVAISNDGKVAAMSSSTFDLSNARDVGIVYVYELSYNEISYNWIRLGNNAIVGISGDELGYSLALSSNGRIVAASSLYNDNSGNNSGLVRVFELSNNLWINRGNIISGRNITNYQSGYSLNLSGNGNIISISSLKGTTDLSYGEVRVYELSSNNIWIKKGRDISGTISGASEGYSSSLSLDGSTLALGSSYRPQDTLISQFVRLGQIIEPDANGGDFGYSVSLNDAGTIVAIGLPSNTVNGIAQVGSVIVYELNSYGIWIQKGQTLNGSSNEQFGWSVSLNGDGTRLAVGAPAYPNGSTLGGVKVYSFSGTTWTSLGGVIVGVYGTGSGEWCLAGRSVSLNSAGNIVAFGEPYTDNYNVGSGSGSVGQGRARVFQYNGSAWVQYGNNVITALSTNPSYNQQGLGMSISLNSSGNRVAIGAVQGDSNGAIAMYGPGHVLVFDLISSTWTQFGPKLAGNSRDEIGSSCSLNATGNIVACGGRKSYPDGTGIGYGGVVRVYIQSGSTWIPRGTPIYGEANYDYAGTSVSLNDAGNILAIGAPNNDGNGADIGHVRVYQYIDASSNWYQMGVDIDGCLSVSIPNRTQIAGLNLDIGSQTNANYFGRSVSLNAAGTRLAIGGASGKGYGVVTEFKAYSGTIPNIGQVKIFRFTNDWNSIGTIQGPQIYLVDTAYNISATLIPSQGQILGEPFTLSGTTYSNTDGKGYGSALNSDGTIFAISSASTPSLGCVRVYKFNGTSWQLMGPIIYGTSTNYIYVYYLNYPLGLLISYDGRTVATIVAGSTTTFAIYKYNDISWNRIGLLTNNRAAIYEANSLSGDGNTFAIANSTIQEVFVWKYINNVWTSIASITNTSYGVAFPSAIALSYNGNTLVVSNRNYPSGDNQQGIAAILKYNDISWQQLGLSIIGPTPVQEFGLTQSSISSDGLTVLIGGYKEGRVFKYNAIDVSWQYLGAIPGQVSGYNQFVGIMSSDGTIVAAWYSNKAFIWKYRLGSWVKIVEYSDGTGYNGQALSADGTVYATCHTTPTYIKLRKLTTIIETQYNENLLYASNKDNYLNLSFGKDIKLSSNGNKIVVGATGPIGVAYNDNLYSFYNYNQGSIWTYEYAGTGTTWKQLGQSIHGISGGDEFGSSVSMSDDGTIISAGSNNYNSNRGYVRVFTYINNNWYQLDNILNGKTATSMAGINALSGDGTTLIQSNNTYNSVYGINKNLVFVPLTTTINTTISGDLAIIGRTYLKSFKISNKFAFDTSGAGYSSNYLASTDISASIVDYYSNVGSTYNKVFKIDACGNVTNYSGVYGAISDSRLKKNIVTSAPKLEDMLKIRVINYSLKGPDSTKYIGVLAQELEELFPELVFEDNTVERFKSVNYSSLTIMLIKAFQEQQVLINNLIATLEELEEEIENNKLINS